MTLDQMNKKICKVSRLFYTLSMIKIDRQTMSRSVISFHYVLKNGQEYTSWKKNFRHDVRLFLSVN